MQTARSPNFIPLVEPADSYSEGLSEGLSGPASWTAQSAEGSANQSRRAAQSSWESQPEHMHTQSSAVRGRPLATSATASSAVGSEQAPQAAHYPAPSPITVLPHYTRYADAHPAARYMTPPARPARARRAEPSVHHVEQGAHGSAV